jgi:hypothetical protein
MREESIVLTPTEQLYYDVLVVSVEWIRNISIIRDLCHIWTPLQKQNWPLETPEVLSTKIKIGYAQL